MKRIESMGLQAPSAWKDELYRVALTKLDIKTELLKNRSVLTQMKSYSKDQVSKGEVEFEKLKPEDLNRMMTCSYFDKTVAQNFEKYQRAKTPENSFKRVPKINKEMMNVSGAKNLKLLRDQGKIKMVQIEKPVSKTLKYSS